MADRAVLEATTRTLTGKKVKQIRRAGRIPATVYGHNLESVTIEIDARAFRQVHGTAGDTQLVDLVVDAARPRPVLIHTTQIDPRRNTAMHIEFYQPNLKEKITVRVPLQLHGEPAAGKSGLTILHGLDSVELECLPTDIPHDIQVDISGLTEVGDAIHIKDLEIDQSVCTVKTAEDEVVAHVVAPQVVTEEVEEAEAETEAEAEAGDGEAAESTEESPAEE